MLLPVLATFFEPNVGQAPAKFVLPVANNRNFGRSFGKLWRDRNGAGRISQFSMRVYF